MVDSTPDPTNSGASAQLTVAVVGCGKMGAAIAVGLLEGAPDVHVIAADPSGAARAGLNARAHQLDAAGRLRTALDAPTTLDDIDVVVLAVKPHLVLDVLRGLPAEPRRLVVSVAAGLPIATLREATGHRVVRVMPNTPAMVGQGTTTVLADSGSRADDIATTRRLFDAVGTTVVLDREELMHVATALAGSGPAYAALIVEALADGAVLHGLPRDTAYAMARSMISGTMTLLEHQHPGELKDGVCSPGGTTIRAVAALEAHGLRHALIEAIGAATRRSRELSEKP